MNAHAGVGQPEHELKEALASGAVSGALRAKAESILAEIERPIRLAVLGLPGSGKTTLINLLAGATIVPAGLRLPSMHLAFGEQPNVHCTLPDGSQKTVPGLNMAEVGALSPIFVDVELPLPALAKISMLEVVAEATAAQQTRALVWASKRCDIAIWCSENAFPAAEQDIWSVAPDEMQDHGLLVLTKSDARGNAKALAEDLAAQQGHAFKRVLPIDSPSAIDARRKDGTVDRDALKASGGMSLISAILKDVDTARQAARDLADVFLHQIGYEPGLITPVQAAPQAKATLRVPEPVKAAPKVVSLTDAGRAAIVDITEQLAAQTRDLALAIETEQADKDDIVGACTDILGAVSDQVMAQSVVDPVFENMRDTSMDAHDLMQLIELEDSETTMSDAVSLVIQLREEMHAVLAA